MCSNVRLQPNHHHPLVGYTDIPQVFLCITGLGLYHLTKFCLCYILNWRAVYSVRSRPLCVFSLFWTHQVLKTRGALKTFVQMMFKCLPFMVMGDPRTHPSIWVESWRRSFLNWTDMKRNTCSSYLRFVCFGHHHLDARHWLPSLRQAPHWCDSSLLARCDSGGLQEKWCLKEERS